MRPDDVDAFVTEMGKTAELFGEPLSEGRALLYYEALADLPLEAALLALRSSRRRLRFFPKPVELRELLDGSPEDQAERALADLEAALREAHYYDTVRFEDSRVASAVLAVWGGWIECSEVRMRSEMPAWQHERKRFLAQYRMLLLEPAEADVVLPGWFEVDNRSRGFPEAIPAPVLIPVGFAIRPAPLRRQLADGTETQKISLDKG